MECGHFSVILGVRVKKDCIKRCVGERGQHVLPPTELDGDARSIAPTARNHPFMHLRMCLDDSVRARLAFTDGCVDDAKAEPDVHHVPSCLAHLRRVELHHRGFPLHHHCVASLVFVAISVALSQPALRSAKEKLAARGMLNEQVNNLLMPRFESVVSRAPPTPVEGVPRCSCLEQQRDDLLVACARREHEGGVAVLLFLVARLDLPALEQRGALCRLARLCRREKPDARGRHRGRREATTHHTPHTREQS
eukprot:scaffold141274_cov28-Tisochrysis_lutea.AAC.1